MATHYLLCGDSIFIIKTKNRIGIIVYKYTMVPDLFFSFKVDDKFIYRLVEIVYNAPLNF